MARATKDIAVRQTNDAPTSSAFNALQTAFDFFNEHLFEGKLPQAIILLHRHGRLARGDRLAFIAAAAADRLIAAEACGYLTRELSRRAPFWRRDVAEEDERRSGRIERAAP